MDHQPLQDSAGHNREEVRRSGRRSIDPSMRGPPSATDELRRISTDRESRPSPDRRNPTTILDDNMNDESFSFPTTRSYSWESQSDGEDRGGGGANRSSARRDQRKFDMTTPTLIDEFDDGADEEEEMVSLQRARWRQDERGVVIKDESSLRRTPGASMYKSSLPDGQIQVQTASLRRTPGAHDMHRSMEGGGVVPHHELSDESAVLGFGLTLSTPVASGNRPRIDHGDTWAHPSPSSAIQSAAEALALKHPSRPPRVPGSGGRLEHEEQQQRGEFTFTPWTLPRGAQYEGRHGACSPNTLRLTEDLGNLLFDEEDSFGQANPQVFRGGAGRLADPGTSDCDQRELPGESWAASYVFKSEQVGDMPSRVPRSSTGRGRRGRNDSSSRRSRGLDRPLQTRPNEDQGQPVASFFPYAQQPKPVRTMQPASIGNPFMTSSFDAAGRAAYPVADSSFDQQQQQPRFFNFGGAFAPPAKDSGVGFRPPFPAQASEQPSSMNDNIFMFQPQRQGQYYLPRSSPSFFESGAPSSGFQSHSFQPLPPMAGATRESPYQKPFPSSSPGFSNSVASPSYGFGGQGQYHAHLQLSGMQATARDFFPMAPPPTPPPPQELRTHASLIQSPPPGWSGPPPAQYVSPAARGNWPSANAQWRAGEYGFSLSPAQSHGRDNLASLSASPAFASSPWSEREVESVHQSSPSVFATGSPAHAEASSHAGSGLVSASPVFSGIPPPRRDQQPAQHARPKPGRKGQPRRGSKPGKAEKSKKAEVNVVVQSYPRRATPVSTNVNTNVIATGGTKKKKQSRGRDSQTPEATGTASACSTPSNVSTPANVPAIDEGGPTVTVEDAAEAKRAELIESPTTRSAFKEFYRRFRSEERSSFQGAEDFAIQSLADGSLPGKVHWRVYLELADLAKRSNRFGDARRLYKQVCRLQPYASQGWLEYSKLEEECGDLNKGARILQRGLQYCEHSENLLTRAIKHEEKMGNISRARELLARLKHVGIEKVWRTILEGALLEARAGRIVTARKVLKYLMHHVPWYGPLYLEAYRLERDLGATRAALRVVEQGLAAIPRYGPLWFGAFRLCEEIDTMERDYDLPRTMAMIDRATSSISKELLWKVHLDAAQMLERAALDQRAYFEETHGQDPGHCPPSLALCRNRFAMTILNCPSNLRWKVWLAAGRMEIAVGNTERARRLFLRAHKVVPDKGRATTLLECARLEEFTGDFDLARAVLCRSRVDYGSDWKVWLESVLLEIRGGHNARAIELAKGALEIHPGTGRLWAALVQLRFFEGGEEAQFGSLKRALNAVPKSGEVWCEGGRIHLNPFSRTFNLERARRHLVFATKFTPQYGDSFLESLRLELLDQWILPIAKIVWDASKSYVLEADSTNFDSQLENYLSELFAWLVRVSSNDPQEDDELPLSSALGGLVGDDTASLIRERLTPSHRANSLNLANLELQCANADPNYGLLWFHCRHGPTDTARRILARATEKVVVELRKFVPFYVTAIIRHSAIVGPSVFEREAEAGREYDQVLGPIEDASLEDLVDKRLLAAPPLFDILKNVDRSQEEGVVFLENTIAKTTFATGLAELNKHQPLDELSLNERRKSLFGTDALFA